MMINNCEPHAATTEAGVTLRCGFDFHLLGSDALGNGPYGDNYWDLTIRDGEIVAAVSEIRPHRTVERRDVERRSNSGSRPNIPTTSWSCTPTDSQGARRFTEDALQAWEQRTQEYVQTVLTRRVAYAADVAAICTARAPELAGVAVPTDGVLDQVAADYTAGAAVLQQTYDELTPLETPRSTDMTVYKDFRSRLIGLAHLAEDSASAADAGDSAGLAELNTAYHELRRAMTAGPAGSGLEDCLASLPE